MLLTGRCLSMSEHWQHQYTNFIRHRSLQCPCLIQKVLRPTDPSFVFQASSPSANARSHPGLVYAVHRVKVRLRVAHGGIGSLLATTIGRRDWNQADGTGFGTGQNGVGSPGRCPLLSGPLSLPYPTSHSPAMV